MRDVNEILFSPVIPTELDFANGEYTFKSGKAIFGWRKTADGIIAYITVPDGVKGKIVFGTLDLELNAGYNEFLIK